MYKAIFEILTSQVSLLLDPIKDYLLMGAIGLVSYKIAFSWVGSMYRIGIIDDRDSGSFFHYLFRTIIFFVCAGVLSLAIGAYRWFVALPTTKWWVLGGIGVLAVGCRIAYAIYEEKQYRAELKKRSTC